MARRQGDDLLQPLGRIQRPHPKNLFVVIPRHSCPAFISRGALQAPPDHPTACLLQRRIHQQLCRRPLRRWWRLRVARHRERPEVLAGLRAPLAVLFLPAIRIGSDLKLRRRRLLKHVHLYVKIEGALLPDAEKTRLGVAAILIPVSPPFGQLPWLLARIGVHVIDAFDALLTTGCLVAIRVEVKMKHVSRRLVGSTENDLEGMLALPQRQMPEFADYIDGWSRLFLLRRLAVPSQQAPLQRRILRQSSQIAKFRRHVVCRRSHWRNASRPDGGRSHKNSGQQQAADA